MSAEEPWLEVDQGVRRARRSELKARLANEPTDLEARSELVAIYRAANHLDQAGRFGIVVDGMATAAELRAYGSLLRNTGADDDRMRVLSRVPAGTEIPVEARELLAAGPERERFLDAALFPLWTLFAASVVFAIVATFVAALSGFGDVRLFAVIVSVISSAALALASAVTCLRALSRRAWRAAVVWGLVAASVVVIAALVAPR